MLAGADLHFEGRSLPTPALDSRTNLFANKKKIR